MNMFTDSAIKKNKNNNKEASAFLHFTAKFPVGTTDQGRRCSYSCLVAGVLR